MWLQDLFLIKRTKYALIIVGESPEEDHTQSFKSVLMVSTPHSGKTTFLQGILNFIAGVSYCDEFRLGFPPEILDEVWICSCVSSMI